MDSRSLGILNSEDYLEYRFEDDGKKGMFKFSVIYTHIEEFTDDSIYNLSLTVYNEKIKDWDDKLYTENDNAVKVFRIVASTIITFTEAYPHAKVAFSGSTDERIETYRRIIYSRYNIISPYFEIEGIINDDDNAVIVPYDIKQWNTYTGFIVKRK